MMSAALQRRGLGENASRSTSLLLKEEEIAGSESFLGLEARKVRTFLFRSTSATEDGDRQAVFQSCFDRCVAVSMPASDNDGTPAALFRSPRKGMPFVLPRAVPGTRGLVLTSVRRSSVDSRPLMALINDPSSAISHAFIRL